MSPSWRWSGIASGQRGCTCWTSPSGAVAEASIRALADAEALEELQQVLAVQPNLEQAHNRIASICLHVGRLHEATIAHERVRRANPKTRSGNLEFTYLYSGDFARAEEAGEAWIRDRPGAKYALFFHPQPPLYIGDLDLAERRLAIALGQLPEEPLFTSLQGMIHARRNQRDTALECVRKAIDLPRSFGHTHHTHYQIAPACMQYSVTPTGPWRGWNAASTPVSCWPFFRIDPHLERLREKAEFKRLVADLEYKYTSLRIRNA